MFWNIISYLFLVAIYYVSWQIQKVISRQQLRVVFENPLRARKLERLYATLAILNWVVILVFIGFTIYLTV